MDNFLFNAAVFDHEDQDLMQIELLELMDAMNK